MASVYCARDTLLGNDVAIKFNNPFGPVNASSSTHVLRGSGWNSDWFDLRSAIRGLAIFGTKYAYFPGFRCAVSAEK
jgi:hypothetical protein